MKKVSNKLTVGKEDYGLDLYCSINLDGQQLQRFRSRSFLGSFAWLLQSLMHSGRDKKLCWKYSFSRTSTWNEVDRGQYNISSFTLGTPATVTVSSVNILHGFIDHDQEGANYIYIWGAEDGNGLYKGKLISGSTIELYHRDGTPVDGSQISGFNGGYCIPSLGFGTSSIRHTRTDWGDDGMLLAYMFSRWEVIVGRKDVPVSVEDVYLHDRIAPGNNDGQLSHGAKSISPLVTDKPTSRFTISKTFTNTGATDIPISEIGVVTGVEVSQDAISLGYTLVRDTLESPVLIPPGKTISIDYELVIRLTPDTQNTDVDGTNGGFLQPFMGVLRDFATATGWGNHRWMFACQSSAGTGHLLDSEVHQPERFGIRLGDDNQFVSMTDVTLNITDNNRDGYVHGNGDGELFHYGSIVDLVSYDLIENKAHYSITRIFENRGSIPVDVKEIGLYGRNSSNADTSTLYARTALAPDDQFTIQPGEFTQVEYEIEVIA